MSKASISFLGDVSFNGRYSLLKKDIEPNPFERIIADLNESDFVVGNLECLCAGGGENHLKKPRLKTTPKALHYLSDLNVGAVSLAHNHVYDNLSSGFELTCQTLEELSIDYTGAVLTSQKTILPVVKTINGIKFIFLNYVTKDTHPSLPENATVNVNFFEEATAKAEIEQLKLECDFLILLMHWGGRVEGGIFPDFDQPKIARRLIDAGADLIIGHHSHTIQPVEEYGGKYIFYSLGNFCFDDIHFDGEVQPMSNFYGLVPTVEFYKDGYDVSYKVIKADNLSISWTNEYSIMTQRNILFKFVSHIKIVWLVYYLYLRKIKTLVYFVIRKDRSVLEKISRLSLKKFFRVIFS